MTLTTPIPLWPDSCFYSLDGIRWEPIESVGWHPLWVPECCTRSPCFHGVSAPATISCPVVPGISPFLTLCCGVIASAYKNRVPAPSEEVYVATVTSYHSHLYHFTVLQVSLVQSWATVKTSAGWHFVILNSQMPHVVLARGVSPSVLTSASVSGLFFSCLLGQLFPASLS